MFFRMVYKSGPIFFRFVTMHACDGRTAGRTDRILIARPRLHCMQRGKNSFPRVLESNRLPYVFWVPYVS